MSLKAVLVGYWLYLPWWKCSLPYNLEKQTASWLWWWRSAGQAFIRNQSYKRNNHVFLLHQYVVTWELYPSLSYCWLRKKKIYPCTACGCNWMKPPNTLYWESVREDWLLIPQSWPRIRTSDILGIQLYTQLTPRRIWISFSECNHVECTVGHIRLPNGHQLYVCVYVHFYICIYIYIWNIYIYTYIYSISHSSFTVIWNH